ncbi:hypothetical protein [Paraflavitalea pollutisoli]|uniref:hypothetical protein n=1 Tax=Paraflavitalea pollutisoli TaxID=3034143 RepID=UPI0023EA7F8C|nr:hypothetical protein [Paraflavitalea sp. H1-2-19X]
MNRTQLFIAFAITVSILGLARCMEAPRKQLPRTTADVRGVAYAGADACKACHQSIHQNWLTTAHHATSARPSLTSIKGSFEPGHNTFRYRPELKVVMEQRKDWCYQVAYMNDVEKQAFPFGMVVGSGRKAQTYLYWWDDNVFQLPISYSVQAGNWVNSPSYPADKVRFDRLVNIGCFECHGSYIERKGSQQEGNRQVDYFDKSKIIYGMDCERCHGPGAEHVSFHTNNPAEKKPQHIALYKQLSQQQQLDLCAQCHSGGHTSYNSIFQFRPGDSLSQYFSSAIATGSSASKLDVHGNQYQLMTASACFTKSAVLTCTSCHDPHAKERDNTAVLSARCSSCHTSVQHSFAAQLPAAAITSNCIDCHMPALPSVISLKEEDKQVANVNQVRTHLIAIYAEKSAEYIKRQRGK